MTGLARALAADFAAVEAQFALQADPDGSIAQGLMTLVYGTTASDVLLRPAEQHVHHVGPLLDPARPADSAAAGHRRLHRPGSATTTWPSSSPSPASSTRRTQTAIDAAVTASALDVTALTAAHRRPRRREPAGRRAVLRHLPRAPPALHRLRRIAATRCRTSGRPCSPASCRP